MKRFLGDLLRWVGIVVFSLRYLLHRSHSRQGKNPSFSAKQAMPSTPMNQRP